MSTIIDGHDPIEVRMAIQTAEDRLADFMQLGDAVRRLMIALLPPEEVEQFKKEHPALQKPSSQAKPILEWKNKEKKNERN